MAIQILVVTHGSLAKELVQVAQAVHEGNSPVLPLCQDDVDGHAGLESALKETILSFPPEDSIIILTDLFGGTPSNLSIPYVQKDKVEVITGVNLAVLLHLLSTTEKQSFEELCLSAKKAGQGAIFLAGEYL